MKIVAEKRSLSELLVGVWRYEIPIYQRNYEWKNEQIDAFLDDLKIALASGEEHFFGSIVLLEGDAQNPHTIIDGQQRLTTFFLLLSLLRDRLVKYHDAMPVPKIHGHGPASDLATMLYNSNEEYRFLANQGIRKSVIDYILTDPNDSARKSLTIGGSGMSADEKRKTGPLRRGYIRIGRWLDEKYLDVENHAPSEIAHLLTAIVVSIKESATFLRISVGDEDDAFILFETLNDRGLRLTASDLLKSFTLRQVHESDKGFQAEEALERWDEAVELLGDYPFTKFLRHYLLSVQNEKVQSSTIFSKFKEIIKKYGDGGAWRNLTELSNAAKNYSFLLGNTGGKSTPLSIVVSRLNLISDTHRILLLRAMSLNFNSDGLLNLAKAIEALAFRWNVTGGNAQEIEDFYRNQAAALKRDDLLSLTSVIDACLQQLPGEKEVMTAMIEGSAGSDSNFQFYVLHKIQQAMTGVALPFAKDQIHVEHLAPKSPDGNSNWQSVVGVSNAEDTYSEKVSDWGNLTLLEAGINVSIGNAAWSTKVDGIVGDKGLKDSSIALTSALVGIAQWADSHIESRTSWIANSMVALTSTQNYKVDKQSSLLPGIKY